MWILTLSLMSCSPAPTIDLWVGDWTLGPAQVVDNTCPVADDALASVFGVDPAASHPLTVEPWDWDGEPSPTEARVSWCLDPECASVLDGTALLVVTDLGVQDQWVREVDGCEITTDLRLFLHCADLDDCDAPVGFVDAEVTGLAGAGCDAWQAALREASGRDGAALGCDASWLTAPPVTSLDEVSGRWHMKDHRTPVNTGPTPDYIYEVTGTWLRVAEAQGGVTQLCSAGSPINNNCFDGFYAGPTGLEGEVAVWRVEIHEDSFEEPAFDCVIHEEYHSVLLPEGRELWMYTAAEWDPAEGEAEACGLEMDFLEAIGQYDADTNQDLFEVNRLVRGL